MCVIRIGANYISLRPVIGLIRYKSVNLVILLQKNVITSRFTIVSFQNKGLCN